MSVDTAHTDTLSSSSSAIELVPTPAVIPPGSPALLPSADGRSSFARRRLSWGRADAVQDPLRLESYQHSMNGSDGPSLSFRPTPSAGPSSQSAPAIITLDDDDPFVDRHHHTVSNSFHPQVVTTEYDAEPFTYANNPHARSSTTSLISSRRESGVSTSTLDDEALLTSNIRHHDMTDKGGDWPADSEHLADSATPRARRRRSQHYTANLSPIDRSGSALKRISQSLRRVSWRVVNFAGTGLDDHIRLSGGHDDNPPDNPQRRPPPRDDDDDNDADRPLEPFVDLSKVLPVRGRTLGLFGPTSRVRRAMYDILIFPYVFVSTLWCAFCLTLLHHRWTEPLILCSIILYAVLLTIQASRTLALPNLTATPPQVVGFFHSWEDYLIFALFVFFRNVPFPLLSLARTDTSPTLQLRSIRPNVRLGTHP
jgi:voltage-dependent calcium channel